MRSSAGHLSASEVQRDIEASKLKEISKIPMTAREMGLNPRLIPLLKNRGVIKRVNRLREVCNHTCRRGASIVWGPGPCYNHYLKKWGMR